MTLLCDACGWEATTPQGLAGHKQLKHGWAAKPKITSNTSTGQSASGSASRQLNTNQALALVAQRRVVGSLVEQVVMIRDALLWQAVLDEGEGMPLQCPECGRSLWEYYKPANPSDSSANQGHRCRHCHWAVELGDLTPRHVHEVAFFHWETI